MGLSFYIISHFLTGAIALFLGWSVFKKHPKRLVNRIFALSALSIAIWSVSYSVWLMAGDPTSALFWARALNLGATLIPVFYLHWILVLLNKNKNKLIVFYYLLTAIFVLFSYSDYYISHTIPVLIFPYWPQMGWLYLVFIFSCWISIIVYCLVILTKELQRAEGNYRKQIKYVLIGSIIGFAGGSMNFPLMLGIDILPPIGSPLIVVYTIIFSYSMVKHRLMDIRFVMRQGSVLAASLLTIISSILLIKYLFFKFTAAQVEWVDYVFLICGILVYPYINKYYYRVANKYFFTSLYDARKVIASLSDKLSSTLLASDIYQYITDEIISALHVKSAGIFIFNKSLRRYELKHYKGNEKNKIKDFIKDKGFYTNYLKTNNPIEVEEVKKTVYVKYRKTVDILAANNVKILIPLRLKNKTIGVIALGEKESKDDYNDQDIAMLGVIGAQSAIAVNNALSYEEIKNFSKKLEHEVDVATEDLIRANSKLRQLDQAKSEFVSIASHQLRTPLTVIKGYISMIMEGSYGKISELQRESLDKVYQSNERLIHLVENLLNISRIESGRLQLNKEVIGLELMVEDVVDELMIRAKDKGLELIYKKPKNKLPGVNIDREKIRQVILNLVDNAIKYTEKGRVEVGVEQKGNYIQCSIKDTGIGIIKADFLDLFDKFSRGTGIELVHTEGIGLGLYVARRMIILHKGKIWAKNKSKGKGSEFYFTIPIFK